MFCKPFLRGELDMSSRFPCSMVTEENCDRLSVSELVKSHVPGAEMSRIHGKELSFRLPMKSVDHFPGMFRRDDINLSPLSTIALTLLGLFLMTVTSGNIINCI